MTKLLLTVAAILFIGAVASSNRGVWTCWAAHDDDKGTYGQSISKKVAEKSAIKLCLEEWGPPCIIEYCER